MNARPDWVTDDYPRYRDIVNSFGYPIFDYQTFGSYQGDEAAILTSGSTWGLIVFGYGSCSGCDELESLMMHVGYGDEEERDWTPIVDLRDRMLGQVHWEPTQALLAEWVMNNPESRWWSYDDEVAKWLNGHLGTTLKIDDEPT